MSIQNTINNSIGLASIVGQRLKERKEQNAIPEQKMPSFPKMARILANEIVKQEAAMQDMKKQRDAALADMWRGFPITEKESVAIRDWKKKHDTEVHGNPHGYHGCSGGGYTYMFYPTSIGTIGSCRCDICHQRAMIAACAHGSYDRNVYQAEMKERDGIFDFQTLD